MDDDLDIEIKPNHSTAYGGILLSAVLAMAALLIPALTDSESASTLSAILFGAALVGVFVMIGAIAVVSAIYKKF